MDFSEARLSRIESQSSTDSSHDQRRGGYFSIDKIGSGFRTLSSRGLLRAKGKATPQPMEDTESVLKFFTHLRWSDLFDLPGEYVLMNAKMFIALSDGDKEWLEKLRRHGTPLACLRSDRGDSILHLAATWGHLELVKNIVSEHPCLLLEPNLKDQLPIHVATRAGHAAVVEALVATITFVSAGMSKADKESLNPYLLKDINGDTALNLALRRRYMEIASSLVKADQRASFLANKDRISPLYLAVEARDVSLVRAMLGNDGPEGRDSNLESLLEGRKYLAHAALKSMSTDTLDAILNEYPRLVDERDEDGRTCLSFGASIGNYEGVCNLLGRSTKGVFVHDTDGSYPIHVAAEKGHIRVVNEILKRCIVSKYMLNRKDQNILHIAANSGKFGIIRQLHKGDHLANEQDVDGNTPLHLATIKWRPRAVHQLAGPNNLFIQNNSGLTALDIAELNLQPNYIVRERLTLVALIDAHFQSDPKRGNTLTLTRPTLPLGDGNKDFSNALLVVAALIATVTFAACFTLPGGFRTSTPNVGMAHLVTNPRLIFFMLFDIVALLSSIIAVVSLIWAQLGDPALYRSSVRVAMALLYLALNSMTAAFLFGMIIAAGNVIWLIVVIYFFTTPFINVMVARFFPHFPLHIPGLPPSFSKFFLSSVRSCNDDDEKSYQSTAAKSVKISGNDHVETPDTS